MKTLGMLLLGLGALGSCTTDGPKTVPSHEEAHSLKVIPLQHAAAIEVANALNNLQRGTRLVADQRTNSLIVSYTSQTNLRELEETIAKLDVEVKPAR